MKRIAAILLLVGLSGIAFGAALQNAGTDLRPLGNEDPDKGIKFLHESWNKAMMCSKKEDKIVFLDCYTSWCGPCKWMAKNTFTNPKVGKFFNEHFVNMKLDMEKSKDGVRLAEKFQIKAYPTLMFIDKNEKEVRRSVGALNVKELLALGKEVAGS